MSEEAVTLVVEIEPKRAERLFGVPLGRGRFRVASIPFLARDLSLGDVVEAADGRVLRVVERSGHETVRLRLTDFATPATFATLWKPFGEAGCLFESTSQGLFAIDVPPRAGERVQALIEKGIAAGDWTIE